MKKTTRTPLTTKQRLERMGTPESRFALRAMALTAARGGHPTTTYEHGVFVFTYPDGTRTTNK